jgi:hypothetical protein
MDRIVQQRRVGDHDVVVIEKVDDEGAGYVLLIDGVLAEDSEPLDHIPGNEELQRLLTGYRR